MLKVYDQSAKVLKEAHITDDELTQTVIGAIAEIDRPLNPDQKGWSSMTRYLSGETDEDRQQWREQILATSHNDFKTFAEKLEALRDQGSVVVFGSKQALKQANEQLPENSRLTIEQALPSEVEVKASA